MWQLKLELQNLNDGPQVAVALWSDQSEGERQSASMRG